MRIGRGVYVQTSRFCSPPACAVRVLTHCTPNLPKSDIRHNDRCRDSRLSRSRLGGKYSSVPSHLLDAGTASGSMARDVIPQINLVFLLYVNT